jgi:Family of unknown function (DUF6502)
VRRTSQQADPIREATFTALEHLLDPLLELLLDVGLSVQELNHAIRLRAIHVASRRLLKKDGRSSNARVAITTGIPRSEIAKLSQRSNSSRKSRIGRLPARRILSGWFSDPRFLNTLGEPAILPIFGPRHSFEKLVFKYGRGIPVRAMLDELIQIGAVEHLSDQRVSAKTRVPISVGLTPSAIEAAGEHCKDLLGTLLKNMRRAEQPLFEATSLVSDASPSMLPIIRRDIAEQGSNLINATSSILKRSDARGKNRNSQKQRVGLTVYYFEDPAHAAENPLGKIKPNQRTNLRRR